MNYRIGTLLLVILLASACQPTGTVTDETQTITIGAVLPLSGDAASFGKAARNGMELALNEHTNTHYHYQFVFEDNAGDTARTATAANKLIEQDHVQALVSIFSGFGNIVNPIAQEHRVIHFGVASDSAVAAGEMNFIHWTLPADEAEAWVTHAQKQGVHRVAILSLNQAGVLAVRDAVRASASQTTVRIVSDEVVDQGTTDMRTTILKLHAEKPDLYLLLLMGPELDLATKQLHEQGITALSSIESFEYAGDPSVYEGLWYVNAADGSTDFAKKYEAAYGIAPAPTAANAYDIVNLLIKGYEDTQTRSAPSATAVAQTLQSIAHYPGALGDLTIDSEGFVHSPAVVRTIENGKPVTLT